MFQPTTISIGGSGSGNLTSTIPTITMGGGTIVNQGILEEEKYNLILFIIKTIFL